MWVFMSYLHIMMYNVYIAPSNETIGCNSVFLTSYPLVCVCTVAERVPAVPHSRCIVRVAQLCLITADNQICQSDQPLLFNRY